MTLIASFELFNAPVILGDTLVTADGVVPSKVISTPLMHDTNKAVPEGAGYSVVATMQKVVLLGDNLCVAWSGRYVFARQLLKTLKSFLLTNPSVTYDELRAFVDAYPRADFGDLQLILYFYSGAGWGWFSNIALWELGAIKNIRVAGSGTAHFSSYLEHISNLSITGHVEDYQALSLRMLAYMSLASIEQVFRGSGIAERWGGAFELVIFDGQRLKKEGPILWLYWLAQEGADKKYAFQMLPPFLYQYTRGNHSYFWLDEGAPNPSRFYTLSAPDETEESETQGPDDYGANVVICGVRVMSPEGIRDGVFIDVTKPGDKPGLRIAKAEANTNIQITPEFFKKFFQSMVGDPTSVTSVEIWGKPPVWSPQPTVP